MAESLAQTDRLRSDLITMVSHELKTPLTAILTSLDLTGSGTIGPDDPQYPELIAIAERQARRLQDMIENLIVVARLQAGSMAVEMQPTALTPLVNDTVAQFATMIREKGLSLTVDIRDDLRILADPPRLRLALKNLLENAIKFTEARRHHRARLSQ